MPSRLPASIYSPSQLRQLSAELGRLKSLRNPKNIVFSNNLLELAAENGIKKLTVTSTLSLLKLVTSTLEQSATITLSLASAPSIEDRDELVTMLRRKLQAQLLIHFIIQPELLAGATIRTDSTSYDLSLRNALFGNKDKLTMRLKNA